ncbi:hypothetical protein CC1G_01256 [Coprinopsis cinerea okayama7|uniref:Uncharacterized protein n=1 Tax=Coprinopsis cinerea (strain Okayama-7 / 130 / ATCC MYA-4618 / FGSC 9003) TaxID=240176 RepID=A8NY50_COPC7|nr:hypothetical protein CC1G_01256 [Coprinopsis cinerea okayama7\|eukprot:XP_001837344.2 hypothetical protein CC1G_01256 [Coprinopsis cinerea okayama7\
MSNSLPSFVELMASLGLEQKQSVDNDSTPSPPLSPKLDSDRTPSSPVKAKSSPSLRDMASRQKTTRYSPYSPTQPTRRRGSLSSVSSASSGDLSPTRETFIARPRSPRSRRHRNPLGLHLYGGSESDLQANMPISTYVRRKTPATTPTSPSFPRDSGSDPASDIPMPLTIPVLPSALLPNSANSESFPLTPNDSDTSFTELVSSQPREIKPYVWDFPSESRHSVSLPYFTGVRISNASRCSLNEQHLRRAAIA